MDRNAKIKQALTSLGASVSPDFDLKMRDPQFAERVRATLSEHGASLPDSAVFYQKYGSPSDSLQGRGAPMSSPIQTPTDANVLKAPKGFRRYAQQRSGNDNPIDYADFAENVATALFPRTARAADAGFMRRVAAGSLDAASLPGRVVSSAFAAPGNPETTFGDATRAEDAPAGLEGGEAFMHSVARDPLNIMLGASGIVRGGGAIAKLAAKSPVAAKVAAAAARLAAPAAENASKAEKAGKLIARAARSAGRGVRDIGLPTAAVTAASDYANGEGVGNSMLSGLESGALASSFGPVADAARVTGRATAEWLPNSAGGRWVKSWRNPFYQDLGVAIDVAKAEGRPLNYTGLRTAQTLGEAASEFANSDVLQFLRAPAFNTAKKLLREQVKPAPAAKKGMEVEDFKAALNTPGMFDELTRYRDIFGGVGGFGKRNLDRIDEMNKKTWGPLFNRYEDLRRQYDDAVKATDYWDKPELRGFYEYLGAKTPDDMAQQLGNVSTKEVRARAEQLADEAVRNRDFGGDPRKLARALSDQIRIYSTPADATIASLGIVTNKPNELPISLAHRAKSQQFQNAYSSGVPDDMTSARQYAANIVGNAHNDIVDQLINTVEQRTQRARVLPSPMLRLTAEEAEFAHNLRNSGGAAADATRVSGLETEGPIYDLQRKYFGGGEMPKPEAAAEAIMQNPANKNLLESRRTDLRAAAADVAFANRVRQTADELEADYNELRDVTNRERRPGLPRMPGKPREAVEREAREQLTTDDGSYSGEIMDAANQHADQITNSIVDNWRSQVVEPWLAKWSPYREAQQGVSQALARTRKLDAALQPWYKAEAGLQRAANTGGNRYSLKPSDVILPILGAGVGAGVDKLNSSKDPVFDGLAFGAGIGALPLLGSRLLRTPAGPKLLRDIGRTASDATTVAGRGVSRNVGAAASSSALAELLSALPTDWAERLRTREYNDDPVDSTSEGRVAEKKGDRK